MSALVELVEGWSDGIPFTLKADSVAVDLTGLTVAGVVHDRYGSDVSTIGKVSVTGTTAGQVTYTPSSSDLLASRSPYSIRFKVTDLSTQVVYFPNGAADKLVVYAEA